MDSRLLRSLVLVCSLTLALPAGWCCLLSPQPAGEPAPQAMCPNCLALQADSEREPAPGRQLPVQNCPCSDRNSVLVKAADTADPLLVPFFLIVPKQTVTLRTVCGLCPVPVVSAEGLSRSLLAWHCRWVC